MACAGPAEMRYSGAALAVLQAELLSVFLDGPKTGRVQGQLPGG
jgi:hypothetical protein